MTEEQKKEMLNGIINNGEKWECRKVVTTVAFGVDLHSDWLPYRLGDEIHDDWEYRKVEKKTWMEDYIESNYGENAQYYIKIGVTEVCKKILEEMKNRALSGVSATTLKNIFKDLGVEL